MDAWIFLAAGAFPNQLLNGIRRNHGVEDVAPLAERGGGPLVSTNVNSCRSVARRGLQLVHVGAHLIVLNCQVFRQQADDIRQLTSLHLPHLIGNGVLRRLRTSSLQYAPCKAARKGALEHARRLVRCLQGLGLLNHRC